MIRVVADWNKNSRIRLTNMINAMKGPNRILEQGIKCSLVTDTISE